MVFRLRRSLAVFGITAFLVPILALNANASSLETIQGKIAQYLKQRAIRSADWGIEIIDPTNDKVLLSLNPDKTFKPASVMKVLTTATALEKLGPEFKYRTAVYTNGVLQPDGTLLGDAILVGRGNPNLLNSSSDPLGKPAFQDLSDKFQAQGIKKIRGSIIGDDSYFEFGTRGRAWTSQDLRSAYGPPITALSINNNVLWVHARPTKYNQLVTVSTEPSTSYFRIRNLGVTGGRRSKRTLYARLIPGTRTIVVSGVLPSSYGSYSRYLVLDNSAELAGAMLKDELVTRGIVVDGDIQAIHQGDLPSEARRKWTLLAEHESQPLVRALEVINKNSQNLHAEMLLRTLGAEFKGSGTDEAGLQVIKDFLMEAGIETKGISLNDGSGLSRANLMTPRFQTSLLLFLSTRPHFDLFLKTLAVSGTDGTLRHRFSSDAVKGVIHAKTGTLNGVSTLSGYMTTKSGRNLVFSIFANNFRASVGRIRKTIDDICGLFVSLY